jgi:hypothetical protein
MQAAVCTYNSAAAAFAMCIPQVEGSVPKELSGTYFRNGPGMQVWDCLGRPLSPTAIFLLAISAQHALIPGVS